MAKYLLAYKDSSMATTPAEQEKQLQAWGSWFGALGTAVVDGGNPCGPSAYVASNGSVSQNAPSALCGYSILECESLAVATEKAKGCPVLASGGAVEVYEIFNAM